MASVARLGLPCLLMATLCVLAGCSSRAEKVEGSIAKAERFLRARELDKAGIELKYALQMDPKSARARFVSGQLAEARRDIQAAHQSYLEAEALAPSYVDAKVALSRIYLVAGENDRARQAVDEALRMDAANLQARTVQTALLARDEGAAAAIAQAESIALAAAGVPVEAWLLLAGLYRQTGQSQHALEALDRGLARHPDEQSLLMVAARICAAEPGLAARAVEYHRRAAAAAPGDDEVWLAWSQFHQARGELDAAEAVLRDAQKAAPDARSRERAVLDFLDRQRPVDVAAAAYRAALRKQPREAELSLSLARLYLKAHRPAEAIPVLQALAQDARNPPEAVAARNLLAAQALAAGRNDEAARLVAEVLRLNPRDREGLLLQARMLMDQGQPAAAVTALRVALRDSPASPDVVGRLARAHLAAGETELARQVIALAVEASPDDSALRLLLAADHADRGQSAAALAELDETIRRNPREAQAYLLKSRYLAGLNETAAAEKALVALTQALPRSSRAQLALAQWQLAHRKPALALQALEAAQRADPADPAVDLLRGDLALARADEAGAEAAWRRAAAAAAPAADEALARLARLLHRRGDAESALALLDRRATADPDDLAVRATRADLLVLMGRTDAAIAQYEQLVTRAPDDGALVNNLAYLLTVAKGDPASLRRALALAGRFARSNVPSQLDSLGWIHYRLGQYEQALAPLERANRLAPDTPLFELHLGMALLRAGQAERGTGLMNKAMRSPAAMAERDEARQLLAQR